MAEMAETGSYVDLWMKNGLNHSFFTGQGFCNASFLGGNLIKIQDHVNHFLFLLALNLISSDFINQFYYCFCEFYD